MHPLITAHIKLNELRAIEPRPWGLYYWPWREMYGEVIQFIRELEA